MVRYYFDLDDNGSRFPDDQGTELQTFSEVRSEAIQALADIMRDAALDADHRIIAMSVHNGDGVILFKVSMRLDAEAPGEALQRIDG